MEDFDEIKSIGIKIRRLFEDSSYVVSEKTIRNAISESMDARTHAKICSPDIVKHLMNAQEHIAVAEQNSHSFNALVNIVDPSDITSDDYRKFCKMISDYNKETGLEFANNCSCNKR